MSWISFSLLSAVLWGGVYAFYGELLKKISVSSVIFCTTVVVGIFFFIVSCVNGSLVNDLEVIRKDENVVKYLIIVFIASIIANFALFTSMKLRNPTIAGMFEITSPLFTALFAWVLFKQNQFSISLLFGGLLIISGVLCIMCFNDA